jgi:uncharacterized protein (TIGR03437 family)
MQHLSTGSLAVIALLASVLTTSLLNAQSLLVTPNTLNFNGVGDSPIPPASQTVQITSSNGESLSFILQYGNGLPYVNASPLTGATPATITFIPYTEPAGSYQLPLTFAIYPTAPPYPGSATLTINLTYSLPPPPLINAIVSAASFQPGPLAPGEIISIFGDNIAPLKDSTTLIGIPPLLSFPFFSGLTKVTFNGTSGAITYAAQGQVNAIVPWGLAGQTTATVVLSNYGVDTSSVTLPVSSSAAAIFAANGSGTGPGAILDANSVPVSASHPAPKGSIIQIFAEGGGTLNLSNLGDVYNGIIDVSGAPLALNALVSLTIGGQAAQILYAGQAPDLVLGVVQVNAMIPQNIASGPQPVVLTIGSNNNATQGITVAVQ